MLSCKCRQWVGIHAREAKLIIRKIETINAAELIRQTHFSKNLSFHLFLIKYSE